MTFLVAGACSLVHWGGSTLAERNLDRITVIVAVVFAVTTIALAILLGS